MYHTSLAMELGPLTLKTESQIVFIQAYVLNQQECFNKFKPRRETK